MDQDQDRDQVPVSVTQEDGFVRWIPIAVPLLAVLLLVATFLIEVDVV